ncbi:DUF2207 domain-containing protein [Microbacterium oxydans]|uniref:DUF2207 domain-containing protein n=1 Tax=Microbacterium oxydans TaxID=82380 RepID=A0A0F0L8Z5_9MICO|nr:DUF2207 domain-containing protein [Microbacterium oxydans]KJL29613.1 hypothetical protein RS83_01633 [Microbacterium oxydans]
MASTRIIRLLAVLALAAAALAAPTAATAASVPSAESAVSADVNDFSYASWDAEYELSLDSEGRSWLHVTETLVARFPDFDQNRGIVRGLPTSYEGARIDTTVVSVTDEDGAAVPYETETDDGVLYVSTGDDDFVQGLTTYVIEYTMRDVVLAADTGVDEFYWDILPLDSTQAIERFSASIAVDPAMSARLSGSARCYTGAAGSTDECDLQGPEMENGAAVFRVESGQRPAGDGVTVAIGFESGTAAPSPARQPNPLADVVPVVGAAGAAGLSVAGWVAVSMFTRRRRVADGIIVAQYDVPDRMPPLLAAALIPGAKDPVPAEIVHLAVRGTLRIEETADTERPRLRRLPGTRIPDQLDVQALDALFVGADADGVIDLPAESETFAARMGGLVSSGGEAAKSQGFITTARSRGAMILQWCAIGVAVVGLGLALWGVISGRDSAIPGLVAVSFGAVLVMISSFYVFSKHSVLTVDGARELEYLLGVKEFIRVAEADRLQMLQSYSGAERRQDGSANVIVLYERLLPYAMLFGMEDEWGRVLEFVYSHEQHGAGWIGDPTSPFLRTQLTVFAVSSHAAATYTAPSTGSSSSAGGSFGGGFSGGGGGGGFSGGR